MNEIKEIIPLPLPFDLDDKIFCHIDHETGEILGENYSYNDWMRRIQDISGINDELLGSSIKS